MNIEIPEHVRNTIKDRAHRLAQSVRQTEDEIERALTEAWAEGLSAGRTPTVTVLQVLRTYLADLESGQTTTSDHACTRACLSVLAENPLHEGGISAQLNIDAQSKRAIDRRDRKI